MPLDLSKTLVVGITTTALFDMTESDSLFQAKFKEDPATAVTEYRNYMLQHENEPLAAGTGMPLTRALLALNKYQKQGDPPLVEVVVMSRNSPETGIRVLNSIRRLELTISRHAFTGGESVTTYLDAFDVDLFLTTRAADAQLVTDAGTCAAALVKAPPSDMAPIPEGQVRIALDADAVLFDESGEFISRTEGLGSFHKSEDSKQDQPMQDGPYAQFLRKLALLQSRLPFNVEFSPVHIAIVTARNAPAEMRVIKTLRHWNIYINEIFFLGGVEKARVLRAFRPHIFFDDQDAHLDPASKHVPSAKVPYRTSSPLNASSEPASLAADESVNDGSTHALLQSTISDN